MNRMPVEIDHSSRRQPPAMRPPPRIHTPVIGPTMRPTSPSSSTCVRRPACVVHEHLRVDERPPPLRRGVGAEQAVLSDADVVARGVARHREAVLGNRRDEDLPGERLHVDHRRIDLELARAERGVGSDRQHAFHPDDGDSQSESVLVPAADVDVGDARAAAERTLEAGERHFDVHAEDAADRAVVLEGQGRRRHAAVVVDDGQLREHFELRDVVGRVHAARLARLGR